MYLYIKVADLVLRSRTSSAQDLRDALSENIYLDLYCDIVYISLVVNRSGCCDKY